MRILESIRHTYGGFVCMVVCHCMKDFSIDRWPCTYNVLQLHVRTTSEHGGGLTECVSLTHLPPMTRKVASTTDDGKPRVVSPRSPVRLQNALQPLISRTTDPKRDKNPGRRSLHRISTSVLKTTDRGARKPHFHLQLPLQVSIACPPPPSPRLLSFTAHPFLHPAPCPFILP